jgi:hypothetical protein
MHKISQLKLLTVCLASFAAACGAPNDDATTDEAQEAQEALTKAAACKKGTSGNQVAVIGDSIIAITHGITKEIEKDAQAAGSLAPGAHYVDRSVSGSTLAGNGASSIPNQYKGAQAANDIKYVIMDGGGTDCMNNGGDAALASAKSMFQTMASDGVQKVMYFFYADPVGSSFASLKTCLDGLRPKMKALCDGLTAPKCYWLDLRPIWSGHAEYTSDGIHPTNVGAVVTGDAVWNVMKANCIAQ